MKVRKQILKMVFKICYFRSLPWYLILSDQQDDHSFINLLVTGQTWDFFFFINYVSLNPAIILDISERDNKLP